MDSYSARLVRDLLKVNIGRMFIVDDVEELEELRNLAIRRLNSLFVHNKQRLSENFDKLEVR